MHVCVCMKEEGRTQDSVVFTSGNSSTTELYPQSIMVLYLVFPGLFKEQLPFRLGHVHKELLPKYDMYRFQGLERMWLGLC